MRGKGLSGGEKGEVKGEKGTAKQTGGEGQTPSENRDYSIERVYPSICTEGSPVSLIFVSTQSWQMKSFKDSHNSYATDKSGNRAFQTGKVG